MVVVQVHQGLPYIKGIKGYRFMELSLDLFYKNLLSKYSNSSLALLEGGVFEGASLLFFNNLCKEYKIDARLYGIDILPRPSSLNEADISYHTINQNDSKALRQFADSVGRFDIVIDDGCHFTRETNNTFSIFWDYIQKGSYVIEDFAVAFATDLPYCQINADKVSGMDSLVYSIAERKLELDIKAFEIIFNSKHSYAVYSK